jgi:hypothetical protein
LKEITMIKPSVGRKVWYRPSMFDKTGVGAMQVAGDAPLDATVIAVWGDRCVNVQVTDAAGKVFTKTSVTLLQEGDSVPCDPAGHNVGGYVEWMPYQVGQAKVASAS